MTWKRINGMYRVYGGNGWANYTGTHYICYPFMINRSKNNHLRWALTHIACGREMGNFRLLSIAKECAKALSHYTHWYQPTTDLVLGSIDKAGERDKIMDQISTFREK